MLVLAASLIFHSKHFTLEYAPVESLNVFPNLSLFAALFYLWIAGLVALSLIPRESSSMNTWEGFVVVSIFVLVYRGMWDIALPDWWADGLSNIITAQFISDTGKVIQTNPNIAYLDFPGLHILAVALGQIAGLNLFSTVTVLLLLLDVLMASSMYLICAKLLTGVRMSTFAALLGMLGSIFLSALFFYPGFLGLVFLSTFLFLLIKRGSFMKVNDWSLVLLLLGGATVTHFMTSAAFAFVLLATLAIGHFTDRPRVALPVITFAIILPAAWLVDYAKPTFRNLAIIASELVTNLSDKPLFWAITVIQANLGGDQPLWATGTKIFWLVIIYVLGTLAVLSYLFHLRSLSERSQVGVGAFLGVMALSVSSTLLSTGGVEVHRFLVFAPLFTAPFIIMLLGDLAPRQSKIGLTALALAAVLLSFPTFLVFRSRVEQYAYYPYEYAAGQFISSAHASRDYEIFSLAFSHLPVLRYNARAIYWTEGQASVDLRSERGLWEAIFGLGDRFLATGNERGQAVYLYSARPKVYYQHIFGILPTSRQWSRLEEGLSGSNLAYDARSLKIYSR